MPLTEIAIVAGTLLTGIKTYLKYRRKQNNNLFLITNNTGIERPEDAPLASAVEEIKDTLYDFTHHTAAQIVNTVREKVGSR